MSTDTAPPFELSGEDRVTLEGEIRAEMKAAGLPPQYLNVCLVYISMNHLLRGLLGVILNRDEFELWHRQYAGHGALRLNVGYDCMVDLSQYPEGRQILETVASVLEAYGEELLPRDSLRRLEELRMWL